MADYLYLFRGGDAREVNQSPEQMQQHMEAWKNWMEKLGAAGKLISGLPLNNDGKVVKQGGNVVDGPYAEGKEIVGGYLMVKADNLDEAADLSKDCPIFENGGVVEVRELMPMEGM